MESKSRFFPRNKSVKTIKIFTIFFLKLRDAGFLFVEKFDRVLCKMFRSIEVLKYSNTR